MGQLALIWDGTWLTWTSSTLPMGRGISSLYGERGCWALRKQVDITSVIHAEGASRCVPLALLSSPEKKLPASLRNASRPSGHPMT